MKFLNSLLLTVLTTGVVLATPPKTHSASRYRDLYLDSPITDDPLPDVVESPPSDLPDWVLVGLTKFVNKTEVEIMNKKDRSRVIIPSKEASELGFEIKSVVQDRNYLDNSVVTLKKGKDTGEVRFDPKFLVLKKVAGTPARGANSSRNTSTPNGRTNTGRTNTRTNTPPVPGARTGNTSTNRTNSRGSTTTNRGTTSGSANRANIPRPSNVPQPSTPASSTNSTNSSNSSSSSQGGRTRYIRRR